MIVLVVVTEVDEETGRESKVASHGIDCHTGKNVIVQCERPERLGAVWHPQMQEWVILDKDEIAP